MKNLGILNKKIEIQEDRQIQDNFKLMMMMNFHPDLEYIYQKLIKLKYFNQFITKNFQNSTKEKLLDFCSHLKMEHYSAGQLIFEEGDSSNDKFYIIYYGSVLLLRQQKMDQLQVNLQKDIELEKKKEEELERMKQEEEEQEQQQQQKLSVKGLLVAQKAAQKFLMAKKNGLNYSVRKELIEKYGEILRTYVRGDGFGEMALMRNVKRSLSIAASSSHLFLVVLKKEDFVFLQKKIEDEIKEKQKLIFQLFQNLKNQYSSSRLESIVYSFDSQDFERNMLITQESEQGDKFFIVQKGELKLQKKVQNAKNNQQIQICIVQPGQFLGEEIVTTKTSIYEYNSIVITQKATLMVVSYLDFHKKFPEECRQQIVRGYFKKKEIRNQIHERILEQRSENGNVEKKGKKIDQLYILSKFDEDQMNGNKKKNIKIQIPKDFIAKYKIEGVQEYCVSQIVKQQEDNLKKNNIRLYMLPPSQPQPYDFGKMKAEDIRKKQHMYEAKLNIKHCQDNFLSKSEHTLPSVIKKQYFKSFRKQQNASAHSLFHVKTQSLDFTKNLSKLKFMNTATKTGRFEQYKDYE